MYWICTNNRYDPYYEYDKNSYVIYAKLLTSERRSFTQSYEKRNLKRCSVVAPVQTVQACHTFWTFDKLRETATFEKSDVGKSDRLVSWRSSYIENYLATWKIVTSLCISYKRKIANICSYPEWLLTIHHRHLRILRGKVFVLLNNQLHVSHTICRIERGSFS
jgi:hypothetical protein